MINKELLFSFLQTKNFNLLEEKFSPECFGNYYYLFSNGLLNVMLCCDRSQEDIVIWRYGDDDNRYDVQLLANFINHKENLIEDADINALHTFFINEYDCIAELFNEENYERTALSLKMLKAKRARQMFPGAFQ